MKYEAVIGLEVHTELQTKRKFSAAAGHPSVQTPIPTYAPYAWGCRESFRY